jgi:hypothetical protein
MAHSPPKTKYRPYLTPTELDIIIDALKTVGSNPHLIHYLAGFKGKIELGLNVPNLTLTPRPSVMERLGLDSPMDELAKITIRVLSREDAYTKWTQNPASCTPKEIEQASVYRFENDLMTPEEEIEYLSRVGA